MAQLPLAGVRLVAENSASFYRDVDKSATSLSGFGAAATTTAKAVTTFNKEAALIKLDTLANTLADQKIRLTQYGQQLDAIVQKEGASSQAAMNKAAAIDSLSGKIGINERKYAALADTINTETAAAEAAARASTDLAGDLDKEGAAARESTTATSKLTVSIVATADAAEKTGGAISKLGQVGIGALRKLGEIGVNALGDLVRGFGNFITGSISAAGDLEATMNAFASVTGDALSSAGFSLDDFKQKFLDLGAATQYSAQQAADAGVELAKGGVPIADIMGGATEATLNLAAAGKLELAPAANIVAKQLGVWGDEGVTAAQVADRLAQAANASTVDVDELALGLANVGGSARAAGLTFDETVIAIGAISPAFSSASTAGTSLNNFLARIQPSTKPAIEAMTKLGLYSRETGSAFYDAQGQFVGLEQASQLLANATGDLSEAERISAIQTIFGNDAKIAAIELARLGAAGTNDFAAAMDGAGTSAEQAAKLNQGFNFAMESLGGSVDNLKIAIGDRLIPVGTALINDFLIPAVNAFGEMVSGVGPVVDAIGDVASTVKTYLVPAIAGGTAAFIAFKLATGGGLAVQLGGLAIAAADGAIEIGKMATSAATATGAFLKMAIPLGAIAISVGAIVLAFNAYNDKVDAAVTKTLALADGYTGATRALTTYTEAQKAFLTEQQREETATQAKRVEILRRALEGATQAYYKLGGSKDRITELNASLEHEVAVLDQLNARNGAAIASEQAKSQAIQNQITDYSNLEAAADGYGQVVEDANGRVVVSTGLSVEALEALQETIQSINEDGAAAFADLQGAYEGHTATMAGLQVQYDNATTEEQRQAIQEQMDQQTIAYAEQERAQRESLGRQLIALAEAEAQKNKVSAAALAEITTRLEQEYGVQRDMTGMTYAEMSGYIEEWALNGGENSAQVITDLRATTAEAQLTSEGMAALAGEYDVFLKTNLAEKTLEPGKFAEAMQVIPNEWNVDLIENFMAGKMDVDAFLAAIKAIPTSKTVNIHTSYTESGTPPSSKGGATPMYTGGTAFNGQAYLVGDNRGKPTPWSEIIVPKQDSTIFNAKQTRSILADASLENRTPMSLPSILGPAVRDASERLAGMLRLDRIAPPPTPQAASTSAVRSTMPVGGDTVTKNYNLTVATPQMAPSVVTTFRQMEAFEL